MLTFDASLIDKTLPVPVGAQLYGLISYTIAHSDLSFGTRLPSVRDLALELGVAPMTVAGVYQQLRQAGLIDIHRGLGAFTARDPARHVADAAPRAALRRGIDRLIDQADALGMTRLDLVSMINAQSQFRRATPVASLSLVFAGVFEEPARDYVAAIGAVLAPEDQIGITTIDALRRDPAARQLCLDADLVITLVYREAEIHKLVPDAQTLAIRFIPSEVTRQRLAALDPRCRVLAVSHFEEYIAVMRPSIRMFAPHVTDIRATWAAAPDLAQSLQGRDVVVYASGAGQVADLVAPGTACFEYRHMPDPVELDRLLAPFLAEKRRAKTMTKSAATATG